MSGATVLSEIAAERTRQDAQWGGPAHDDTMPLDEFVALIRDYAGWARVKAREGSMVEARQRLIQVAALAVAAVESLDRRGTGRPAVVPRRSAGMDWE
ncbi:hypothetical protein [Caldovatus aquaticus]|uniref:Uncharacterized protein n=1 Tax=Caldovatus aquaticus TaxID=2865671 RepID=A0ABS7EZE6_9PROT|nr:hypothetical protein [Caldovatus aquaticus]MBW8267936.1 hypothetical protein [Caldovatus aquaticus]